MAAPEFLFRDDFDGAGLAALDRSSWNVEVNCNGGGNNELQCYVDSQDNIDVRDGMLHITARKESDGRVTSGRLTTEGKVEIAYGRWEDGTSELPGGLEGSGPMAIFASDLSRTVVVSAFTNTMAQSQSFVSDPPPGPPPKPAAVAWHSARSRRRR